MLMKKVYLMFFGTMFAMCAMAQQGKGGLVLDSTYTTTGDGTRQEKSINEYNANKQQTATFMYSYKDKNANQLSVPLLTSKTEPTYDAQSRVTKLNTYSYANDAYTLTAVMEMSGFNSSGLPTVTIMKAVSEEDPSAGLQNMMKTEVTKFGNYGITKTISMAESRMRSIFFKLYFRKCYSILNTLINIEERLDKIGIAL